ncbi:uncharacterized protein LOC100180955 [Ciona intestinalis]
MKQLLRLPSDDDWDGEAPPYLTTVGRTVNVNNHIVLVGKFTNPDGTVRKAVVLGTLHAKPVEHVGSGDSVMTLPSDMIPGIDRTLAREEGFEIVNEDIEGDVVDGEYGEPPKLRFIVPFRNLMRKVRNRFRPRSRKWLSDSGISTNYEGNMEDEIEENVAQKEEGAFESGFESEDETDEEISLSKLDMSVPLVIGRGKRRSTKTLCPKPETCPYEILNNTLNVIPTLESKPPSRGKVWKKYNELLMEINKETEKDKEEWTKTVHIPVKPTYDLTIEQITCEAEIERENRTIKTGLRNLRDCASASSNESVCSYSDSFFDGNGGYRVYDRPPADKSYYSYNTNSKFYKKLVGVVKGWVEVGARGFRGKNNLQDDENIYDDVAIESVIQVYDAGQELFGGQYSESMRSTEEESTEDYSGTTETHTLDGESSTLTNDSSKTTVTTESSSSSTSKDSSTSTDSTSHSESSSEVSTKKSNLSVATSNEQSSQSSATNSRSVVSSGQSSKSHQTVSGSSSQKSTSVGASLTKSTSKSSSTSKSTSAVSNTTNSGSASSKTTNSGSAGSKTTNSGSASSNTTNSASASSKTTKSGSASSKTTNSGSASSKTKNSGSASSKTTSSTSASSSTNKSTSKSSAGSRSSSPAVTLSGSNKTTSKSSASDDKSSEQTETTSSHSKLASGSSGKSVTKSSATGLSASDATEQTSNDLSEKDQTEEDIYGTGDNLTTSQYSDSATLQPSAGIAKWKRKVEHSSTRGYEDTDNNKNQSMVCIGRRETRREGLQTATSPDDWLSALSSSAAGDLSPRKRVTFTNDYYDSVRKRRKTKNNFKRIASRLFSFLPLKKQRMVEGNQSCIDLPSVYESREMFYNENDDDPLLGTYWGQSNSSNSLPKYIDRNSVDEMYAVQKSLSLMSKRFHYSFPGNLKDDQLYMSSINIRPSEKCGPTRNRSNVLPVLQSTGRTKVTIGRPRLSIEASPSDPSKTTPLIRTGPQSDVPSTSIDDRTTRSSLMSDGYDSVAGDDSPSSNGMSMAEASSVSKTGTVVTSEAETEEGTLETEDTSDVSSSADNGIVHENSNVSMWSGTDLSASTANGIVPENSNVSMWSGTDLSASSASGKTDSKDSSAKSEHIYDKTNDTDSHTSTTMESSTHLVNNVGNRQVISTTSAAKPGPNKSMSKVTSHLNVKPRFSLTAPKELAGFPGSILVLPTKVEQKVTEPKEDKESSNSQFVTATSSSVPRITKFFTSWQSLKEAERPRPVEPDHSTSFKLSKVYGQNAMTSSKQSLGSSQSLYTISTSDELDLYGDKKPKRNRFPKGLLKSGAMDYSSTNVSQVTTWWDETSTGVTRQESCEENMRPRLDKDDDEIRARGTELEVDRNTNATLLYLRGDGLLLRSMQVNDRDKVGNYRSQQDGRLRFGKGKVDPSLQVIQCMDSDHNKLTMKSSKTNLQRHNRRMCDDPRCANEKCSSSTLNSKEPECPAGYPCREIIPEDTITLKDVNDLVKRNKKNSNLYKPEADMPDDFCTRCPQHEKRFYPYFPNLFEKKGLEPFAERLVNMAMVEGKETFKHYFPLYTEQDLDDFSDKFWFNALQDGVARYLTEESINSSWFDLQAERHFDHILRGEIRERVDAAIADEYAINCISAGRRVMIVQDFITKNTPPKDSLSETGSVASRIPLPDAHDNSKFITFATTVPDDEEGQANKPDHHFVKRDGADEAQMLVPTHLPSKIKALKIVHRVTERGIDRYLNPPSVYGTASDSSFGRLNEIESIQSSVGLKRSEYTNMTLEGVDQKRSNISTGEAVSVDSDVQCLLSDIIAAVVLSDELQLNAFTSKPGAQLAYGLAQTFSNRSMPSSSIGDMMIAESYNDEPYLTEEDGAKITIYKMVCAISISEELRSKNFTIPLSPIIKEDSDTSSHHSGSNGGGSAKLSSEDIQAQTSKESNMSVQSTSSKNSNNNSYGSHTSRNSETGMSNKDSSGSLNRSDSVTETSSKSTISQQNSTGSVSTLRQQGSTTSKSTLRQQNSTNSKSTLRQQDSRTSKSTLRQHDSATSTVTENSVKTGSASSGSTLASVSQESNASTVNSSANSKTDVESAISGGAEDSEEEGQDGTPAVSTRVPSSANLGLFKSILKNDEDLEMLLSDVNPKPIKQRIKKSLKKLFRLIVSGKKNVNSSSAKPTVTFDEENQTPEDKIKEERLCDMYNSLNVLCLLYQMGRDNRIERCPIFSHPTIHILYRLDHNGDEACCSGLNVPNTKWESSSSDSSLSIDKKPPNFFKNHNDKFYPGPSAGVLDSDSSLNPPKKVFGRLPTAIVQKFGTMAKHLVRSEERSHRSNIAPFPSAARSDDELTESDYVIFGMDPPANNVAAISQSDLPSHVSGLDEILMAYDTDNYSVQYSEAGSYGEDSNTYERGAEVLEEFVNQASLSSQDNISEVTANNLSAVEYELESCDEDYEKLSLSGDKNQSPLVGIEEDNLAENYEVIPSNHSYESVPSEVEAMEEKSLHPSGLPVRKNSETDTESVYSIELPEIQRVETNPISLGESESAMSMRTYCVVGKEWDKMQSSNSLEQISEEKDKCRTSTSYESPRVTIGYRPDTRDIPEAQTVDSIFTPSITIGKRIQRKLMERGAAKSRLTDSNIDKETSSHLFVYEGDDYVENTCETNRDEEQLTEAEVSDFLPTYFRSPQRSETNSQILEDNEKVTFVATACNPIGGYDDKNIEDTRSPRPLRVVWELPEACLAECASMKKPFELVLKGTPRDVQCNDAEAWEVARKHFEQKPDSPDPVAEETPTPTPVPSLPDPPKLEHASDPTSYVAETYALKDLFKDLNVEVENVVQAVEDTGRDVSMIPTPRDRACAVAAYKDDKEGTDLQPSTEVLEKKLDVLQDLIKDYISQVKNDQLPLGVGDAKQTDYETAPGLKKFNSRPGIRQPITRSGARISCSENDRSLSKQLGLFSSVRPSMRGVKRLQRSGVKQYSFPGDSSFAYRSRMNLDITSESSDSIYRKGSSQFFKYANSKRGSIVRNRSRTDSDLINRFGASTSTSSDSEFNYSDLCIESGEEELEQDTKLPKKKRWYKLHKKVPFLRKTIHPSAGICEPSARPGHKAKRETTDLRRGGKPISCIRKRSKKPRHRYRVRFERTCSCSDSESVLSCGHVNQDTKDSHDNKTGLKPQSSTSFAGENTPNHCNALVREKEMPKGNTAVNSTPANKKYEDSEVIEDIDNSILSPEESLHDDNENLYRRFPLFSPTASSGTTAKCIANPIEPTKQFSCLNLIHGGITVKPRSPAYISAHLRTNQPNESVQLTVPLLREYFEDLKSENLSGVGGGNTVTGEATASTEISQKASEISSDSDSMSFDRNPRTVKLSSENTLAPHPSSGKTIILVHRGMDPPPKTSEESVTVEPVRKKREDVTKMDRRESRAREQPHTSLDPNTQKTPSRYKEHFKEERRRSVVPEERRKSVMPEERRKSVTPEERRRSVMPEERRKSVMPEERRKSVMPEERRISVMPFELKLDDAPQVYHEYEMPENIQHVPFVPKVADRRHIVDRRTPVPVPLVDDVPVRRQNSNTPDQAHTSTRRAHNDTQSAYDFIEGLPISPQATPRCRRRNIKSGFRPVPKKTPIRSMPFDGSEEDSSDSLPTKSNFHHTEDTHRPTLDKNRHPVSIGESSLTSRNVVHRRRGWRRLDSPCRNRAEPGRRKRAISEQSAVGCNAMQGHAEEDQHLSPRSRVTSEEPVHRMGRRTEFCPHKLTQGCQSNHERELTQDAPWIDSINFLRGIPEQQGIIHTRHNPVQKTLTFKEANGSIRKAGCSSSCPTTSLASRSTTVKVGRSSCNECCEGCCNETEWPNNPHEQRVDKSPSRLRQTWKLLSSKSSLQSVHRIGSETLSRLWQNVRPSASLSSQESYPGHECPHSHSRVSTMAAKTVTSITDAFVRIVAVVTVLYFVLHENIFLMEGEPPT